jgi:hypothetical protein
MPKPTKPRPKKPPAASVPPAEPLSGKTVTTGLNLPEELHTVLQAVAMKRARETPSGRARPSVSAVLARLVADNREALEAEAGQFLELAQRMRGA